MRDWSVDERPWVRRARRRRQRAFLLVLAIAGFAYAALWGAKGLMG